jgi:hypothetical protein
MVAVKSDVLTVPLDELESVLESHTFEPPLGWARHYRDVLRNLSRALRQHIANTESAGGALTTLKQQTLATLDHSVHQLRLDHIELLNTASELYWIAQALSDPHPEECAGKTMDGEMAREAGGKLLRRVHEHQEAERKLLMDTINTDLGVGD